MKELPEHLKNVNATFRPNQVGLKKIWGDLEADAMEIAWEFDRPVTIREVYEVMRDRGGGALLSYLNDHTSWTEEFRQGLGIILLIYEG